MATRKKAETVTPEMKTTGRVVGGSLFIRSKAGTDGDVVGTLENGTEIEILKAGKEWHKIQDGYVMAKWIEIL